MRSPLLATWISSLPFCLLLHLLRRLDHLPTDHYTSEECYNGLFYWFVCFCFFIAAVELHGEGPGQVESLHWDFVASNFYGQETGLEVLINEALKMTSSRI